MTEGGGRRSEISMDQLGGANFERRDEVIEVESYCYLSGEGKPVIRFNDA